MTKSSKIQFYIRFTALACFMYFAYVFGLEIYYWDEFGEFNEDYITCAICGIVALGAVFAKDDIIEASINDVRTISTGRDYSGIEEEEKRAEKYNNYKATKKQADTLLIFTSLTAVTSLLVQYQIPFNAFVYTFFIAIILYQGYLFKKLYSVEKRKYGKISERLYSYLQLYFVAFLVVLIGFV